MKAMTNHFKLYAARNWSPVNTGEFPGELGFRVIAETIIAEVPRRHGLGSRALRLGFLFPCTHHHFNPPSPLKVGDHVEGTAVSKPRFIFRVLTYELDAKSS